MTEQNLPNEVTALARHNQLIKAGLPLAESPIELESSLRDREIGIASFEPLDDTIRERIKETSVASIALALELLDKVMGGEERQDYGGEQASELGSDGTALVTQGGFARLQTVDIGVDTKLSGSPHDKLLEIAAMLPDDRKIFRFNGLDLILRRLAVIKYSAAAKLARLPLNEAQEKEASVLSFPTQTGHRDRLPDRSIIASEQLSGASSEWSVINTSQDRFDFLQATGQRVLMRSQFEGTSEGRPWHDVHNNGSEPRLTLLTVYGSHN